MRVFLVPHLNAKNTKDLNELATSDGINTDNLFHKPLNSVGYNYYTVQTTDSFYKLMLAPENLGKRFYYIIENLITDVPNYDKNIKTISKKYFGEDVSDNFLQLWEIVLNFNLIDKKINVDNKECEDMFKKLKKFVNFSIEKSKNYSHLVLLNDITIETTEYEINKRITKYIDNLEKLDNGGHFIIKVKDLITMPSVHLLYFLSYCFENVYVYRPSLSYISHGEKYIICKNYNESKTKKFKYNIENDYLSLGLTIPSDFIFGINLINRVLMIEEYIMRNKMRNYINSQNYYGEEYHNQLGLQQVNSDKWLAENFMLSSKDYDELRKIKESELEKEIKEFNELLKEKEKNSI